MASLISKASLLMVPSVYEDGTLYNVLPSGNKAPDETGNHNGYDQTRADFTFSRGSNLAATRVNSDGLIEKGRENLLLNSNNFNNSWNQSGTTRTSGQSGYDGTNDAWKIERDGAAGLAFIHQTISTTGVHTQSVYAKANTEDWIYLQDTGTGGGNGYFDLVNGVAGTTTGIDASIDSVGNGWYRIQVVGNRTASGNIRVFVAKANGNLTVTGSIYIQDTQFEAGLVATDYIETGSTTAQAGILEDMPRINYDANGENGALLLEPSRTNLIENSEYIGGLDVGHTPTISIESETNPEGYSFTYKVTAVNTSSRVQDNIGTQGNNMVFSGFFKGVGTATRLRFRNNQGNQVQYNIDASGNFTLHSEDAANDNYGVEDYGNGWYRVYFETTTVNNADNYLQVYADSQNGTGSVYVWGLQAEAGSYASSYIPTHGAAVTRGEETTSRLTLPETLTNDFTLFFDFEEIKAGNGWIKFLGSSNGLIYGFYSFDGHFDVYNGSAFMVDTSADENGKIALKQSGSSVKIFINGVDKTKSGATANTTDIAKFEFSTRSASNTATLKQMVVFNEALSDAECISLTS